MKLQYITDRGHYNEQLGFFQCTLLINVMSSIMFTSDGQSYKLLYTDCLYIV